MLEAPLGVAQATLLGGEVRDPGAVIAEFERRSVDDYSDTEGLGT